MKTCKQSDHKWQRITEPMWPYRVKCLICGVIGKMYMGRKFNKKAKVIPIK